MRSTLMETREVLKVRRSSFIFFHPFMQMDFFFVCCCLKKEFLFYSQTNFVCCFFTYIESLWEMENITLYRKDIILEIKIWTLFPCMVVVRLFYLYFFFFNYYTMTRFRRNRQGGAKPKVKVCCSFLRRAHPFSRGNSYKIARPSLYIMLTKRMNSSSIHTSFQCRFVSFSFLSLL